MLRIVRTQAFRWKEFDRSPIRSASHSSHSYKFGQPCARWSSIQGFIFFQQMTVTPR